MSGSIHLSDFAGFAARQQEEASANTQGKKPREEAKLWLNIGYFKTYKDEDGHDQETFVTLKSGIPLDQVGTFDMAKVKKSGMATLRRDQNRFLEMLLARAESVPPGEGQIVVMDETTGIGIELRRVGEAAAPVDEEDDAPVGFSFR